MKRRLLSRVACRLQCSGVCTGSGAGDLVRTGPAAGASLFGAWRHAHGALWRRPHHHRLEEPIMDSPDEADLGYVTKLRWMGNRAA